MATNGTEWREMTGRDLDRLVHEVVFGRCAHRGGYVPRGHDLHGFDMVICPACNGDPAGSGHIPWYSGSWDNAERVVKHLRAAGWLLYLHGEGGMSQQWVAYFAEDAEEPADSGEELGDTAPLAICRAALAATEG